MINTLSIDPAELAAVLNQAAQGMILLNWTQEQHATRLLTVEVERLNLLTTSYKNVLGDFAAARKRFDELEAKG